MLLGELASLRTGLVIARKQAKEESRYKYKLLNLKSMDPDGRIRKEELDIFTAVEKLQPYYLTQPGDVIIRLSKPYTAVLIDQETEGLVISSYFLIIKANSDVLNPGYLYWLLNTKKITNDIYRQSTSNMLGMVHKEYFMNLRIVLLPLEQQKRIAKLNFLAKREHILLQELATQKEIFNTAVINKIQAQLRKGKNNDN